MHSQSLVPFKLKQMLIFMEKTKYYFISAFNMFFIYYLTVKLYDKFYFLVCYVSFF